MNKVEVVEYLNSIFRTIKQMRENISGPEQNAEAGINCNTGDSRNKMGNEKQNTHRRVCEGYKDSANKFRNNTQSSNTHMDRKFKNNNKNQGSKTIETNLYILQGIKRTQMLKCLYMFLMESCLNSTIKSCALF